MAAERSVVLTFDHEEFDMPFEYNSSLTFDKQIEVSREGMKAVHQVLNLHGVQTTLFTTATYAIHNKKEVQELSLNHEIASHTFYHSSYKEADLLASRLALEEIIGKPVKGLRMPRMKQPRLEAVKEAGYTYDSSVNPTWLPGRYNYLKKPRTLYVENGLIRLPASVTPNLRIPLFWLLFKNAPFFFYKKLALSTLKRDKALSLYFHPWEFADLTNYHIPVYTKNPDSTLLLERLEQLIVILKKEASFKTMSQYISEQAVL